ncbi:MAG: ABC transporter ATP-binding protein [Promethearchaeota archaeon]
MAWYGLEAEQYDRIYKDKDLLNRIFKYFSPYKRKMGIVTLLLTATAFTYAAIPLLTSIAISNLETNREPIYLVFIIISIFSLNCLAWIFNYFRQKYSSMVIGDIVLDLRHSANAAVLDRDLSFFDKNPIGKIVSRMNTDSRDFGQIVDLTMQVLSSFLMIIILLAFMLFINLTLALIFMISIPIFFIVALTYRKVARRLTLLGQRALASVNAYVKESFSGIQIAKTFRQESKLYKKFQEVNNQSYDVNLKKGFILVSIFPTLGVTQGIILALIIYFGGNFVINGQLSVGDLYLFLQSLSMLFFPLLAIAAFWPQLQLGLAASERIFALIDNLPVVVQDDNKKPEILKGKIEFKNLTFYYDKKKEVFKDFSLTINPGESIAIVGHTGAGKSSLAKLIARFYEFQGGDILIDGISIRDFDLKTYRKHIGIIPQTPFLWATTLLNNVKYGSDKATEKEVLDALDKAGGADWIKDLSYGLSTYVGERGNLISMGQRQLVVFARTLLQNPSILILDEATASVDPFTETRIQDALEKTIKGRTSIVIAHRLWTVRHVERIIVLDHGKIVEEGNHEELIARGGKYANLYNTYFRHQSLEYIEKIKEICEEPEC